MNSESVSLVVPGRNCAATIRSCLSSVVPLLDDGAVAEIIFVDDGSTDATASIVADFPVTCIRGEGRGSGAARNLGWREARHPLIWFIDADCVAEPDAIARLLPHMNDPAVGGVGGSYGIMNPESLLASLIHEEIIERHCGMPARVDFLATFNVLYRRAILEQLGGFDERYLKAQDAELSFRVLAAGHELAFERASRVKHFHPTRWLAYFRTQRHQGFWRVRLHLDHRGRAAGDTYSSWVDHIQPPLAMAAIASLLVLLLPPWPTSWILPAALWLCFAIAHLPLTLRLIRRTRRLRYAWFAPMSILRSVWRGVGMTHGALNCLWP